MAIQDYVFTVKTRNGGVVSNIVKQGASQLDAERKLSPLYPDCIVLDVQASMKDRIKQEQNTG